MFKILKGGTQLGMTEALSYIKKAKNGCYVLCSELEASGIVFPGHLTNWQDARKWET